MQRVQTVIPPVHSPLATAMSRRTAIQGVDISVQQIPQRLTAQIIAAHADRTTLQAGQKVTIEASVLPWHGEIHNLRIPITLPLNLPPGPVRLLISDPLFFLLGYWYGDAAVKWMERRTKTGNKMGIVTFSDSSGQFEAVLFSEMLQQYRDLLEPGKSLVLTVELGDSYFSPTYVKVDPGAEVSVHLVNDGATEHTFTIDSLSVDQTLAPGEESDASFTMPDSNAVRFYCRFHAASGMQGAAYSEPGQTVAG